MGVDAATDGLQQVVDGLAARLGRSVAVDDARGRLVAVSRHFGDEDPLRVYAVLQRDSDPRVIAHFRAHGIQDWSAPGRVPADPDLGFRARVCCPARAHGLLFGHLFLVDDGVTEPEVALASAAADEVGRLMYARVVLHGRDRERRERLVHDLVAGSADDRGRARADVAGELDVAPGAPVVVVVVEHPGEETTLRTAVERADRERTTSRMLTAVRGRRATLVLFGDTGGTGDDTGGTGGTARGVTERVIAATAPGPRTVAGIGGPHTGPDAAARAFADARLAAHAATLLPWIGDVVDEDGLGVYGVLLRLPRAELTDARLPAGLRRLLDRDTGGTLAGTLETYLDRGGDATRTAADLHLHRSTLYYRLGRIETLGGIALHDGGQRLALHLGVKLHRVLDAYRARPDLLP